MDVLYHAEGIAQRVDNTTFLLRDDFFTSLLLFYVYLPPETLTSLTTKEVHTRR